MSYLKILQGYYRTNISNEVIFPYKDYSAVKLQYIIIPASTKSTTLETTLSDNKVKYKLTESGIAKVTSPYPPETIKWIKDNVKGYPQNFLLSIQFFDFKRSVKNRPIYTSKLSASQIQKTITIEDRVYYPILRIHDKKVYADEFGYMFNYDKDNNKMVKVTHYGSSNINGFSSQGKSIYVGSTINGDTISFYNKETADKILIKGVDYI